LTEAAEDFGRILELSGESGPVLGCRGQVYAEMGEFQLAIGDLDRALELSRDARDNAGTAYALSGRGLARGGLGLFVEASRDFEESLRLSPDNAWAHLNLGIVLEKQGKRTEAAAALRRALLADQPPLTKRKCSQAEALLARLEPGNEPPENG
jgi:tetratricopeptide (TPR) repeat protein